MASLFLPANVPYHATPARSFGLCEAYIHVVRPPRQKAMLAFALKVSLHSSELVDDDYAVVREHGFSDEDIWDIGAIAAFFALSNRMANLISMRPNDEFFVMGRIPRTK